MTEGGQLRALRALPGVPGHPLVVGRLFLPWSIANAEAIGKGEKSLSMTLAGATWSQEPQKYHARSLQEIRRKYAAVKGATGLDDILEKAGCLSALRGAAT